jgi:hypothetical protein
VSYAIVVEEVKLNEAFLFKEKDTGIYPNQYIEVVKQKEKVNSSDEEYESDADYDTETSQSSDDSFVKIEVKDNRRYRISLYIQNIGAAMPIEAWVNSCTSKNRINEPVLRESIIGGFGYGLKDAALASFSHSFDIFQVSTLLTLIMIYYDKYMYIYISICIILIIRYMHMTH